MPLPTRPQEAGSARRPVTVPRSRPDPGRTPAVPARLSAPRRTPRSRPHLSIIQTELPALLTPARAAR